MENDYVETNVRMTKIYDKVMMEWLTENEFGITSTSEKNKKNTDIITKADLLEI